MRQSITISILLICILDCQSQADKTNTQLDLSKSHGKPKTECGTELDSSLALVLRHHDIQKFINQTATSDTLLINTDYTPECSRLDLLAIDDFQILLSETNTIFFNGIEQGYPHIRLLDFRTNWAWTSIELLVLSEERSLYIETYVTHEYTRKGKLNYLIRDMTLSLGELKKE